MDLGLYAYHLNFEVQIMIKLPAAAFFVFFGINPLPSCRKGNIIAALIVIRENNDCLKHE